MKHALAIGMVLGCLGCGTDSPDAADEEEISRRPSVAMGVLGRVLSLSDMLPCKPHCTRPVSGQTLVVTSAKVKYGDPLDGIKVVTDGDGYFEVALSAGTYHVSFAMLQDGALVADSERSGNFTLNAGSPVAQAVFKRSVGNGWWFGIAND